MNSLIVPPVARVVLPGSVNERLKGRLTRFRQILNSTRLSDVSGDALRGVRARLPVRRTDLRHHHRWALVAVSYRLCRSEFSIEPLPRLALRYRARARWLQRGIETLCPRQPKPPTYPN